MIYADNILRLHYFLPLFITRRYADVSHTFPRLISCRDYGRWRHYAPSLLMTLLILAAFHIPARARAALRTDAETPFHTLPSIFSSLNSHAAADALTPYSRYLAFIC